MAVNNKQVIVLDGGGGMGSGVVGQDPTAHTIAPILNNHLFVFQSHRRQHHGGGCKARLQNNSAQRR